MLVVVLGVQKNLFNIVVVFRLFEALARRHSRSFFFQAEDGIRDLVRSRGLGDVYKRQIPDPFARSIQGETEPLFTCLQLSLDGFACRHVAAVSYTHLTLPTIYSV